MINDLSVNLLTGRLRRGSVRSVPIAPEISLAADWKSVALPSGKPLIHSPENTLTSQ